MKFLVDAGVGKKVEAWLKQNGYDILPVRDIDSRAKDSQILQWAVDQHRMVITMDRTLENWFTSRARITPVF